MMIKKEVVALSGLFIWFGLSAQVNTFWSDAGPGRPAVQAERRIIPKEYREVELSFDRLETFFGPSVQGVHEVSLPHPSGGAERVRYWPNVVMHPELAARYPSIRTFAGESMDRPGVQVRMDLTPQGFHAMFTHQGKMVFVDPLRNAEGYAVYYQQDAHSRLEEEADRVIGSKAGTCSPSARKPSSMRAKRVLSPSSKAAPNCVTRPWRFSTPNFSPFGPDTTTLPLPGAGAG